MPNDHGNANGAALSSPNIHEVSVHCKKRNKQLKHLPSVRYSPPKEKKMTTTSRNNEEKGAAKTPARTKTPVTKSAHAATTATVATNTPAPMKPAKKPPLVTPTTGNETANQNKGKRGQKTTETGQNMDIEDSTYDDWEDEEDDSTEAEKKQGQKPTTTPNKPGAKEDDDDEEPTKKGGHTTTKHGATAQKAAPPGEDTHPEEDDKAHDGKDEKEEADEQEKKEKDWKEVPTAKSKAKRTGKAADEASEKEEPATRAAPATAFRIPLNVRIIAQKSSKRDANYNVHTIVSSILIMLQKVHEKTWIGPIDPNDSTLAPILSPGDVPSEEATLLEYAEDPSPTRRGHFQMRMYIHADIEFHKFKQDRTFMEWLQKEKLNLEVNTLATSKPVNVGFFANLHPRADLLDLYEARLKLLLPAANFPEYQLTTSMLFAGEAKCKVVVVSAATEDVEKLALLFLSAGMESDQIDFYSWLEYTSLNLPRRLTVVNQQNTFSTTTRTLIVRGFTDANPTMQKAAAMHDNNEEAATDEADEENTKEATTTAPEKDIDLAHTTMSEFIQLKFKAGDGTNLFQRVYPPAGGTIACLIVPYHHNEAKSLFRSLTGELARDMCEESLQQALIAPEEARTAATSSEPWRPFTLATQIAETNPSITSSKNKTQRSKRPKQGRTVFNPSVSFAAIAATGATPNPSVTRETATQANAAPVQQHHETNNKEAWDAMQFQINQLQTAHNAMKDDQHAMNANVTKTRLATKKSIDKLEEKHAEAVSEMQTRQESSETKLLDKIAESSAESSAKGDKNTLDLKNLIMMLRHEDQQLREAAGIAAQAEKEQIAAIARREREQAELHRTHTELLLGNLVKSPGANVYNHSKNKAGSAPNSAERVTLATGRKKSRVTDEFFADDAWENNRNRMDYSMTEINKENGRAIHHEPAVDTS
jgi:hypothetical protein